MKQISKEKSVKLIITIWLEGIHEYQHMPTEDAYTYNGLIEDLPKDFPAGCYFNHSGTGRYVYITENQNVFSFTSIDNNYKGIDEYIREQEVNNEKIVLEDYILIYKIL